MAFIAISFRACLLKQINKNLSDVGRLYFDDLNTKDKNHIVDIASADPVVADGVLMAVATVESWAAGQTCGPLNNTQAKAWSEAEDKSRAERDLITRYETD